MGRGAADSSTRHAATVGLSRRRRGQATSAVFSAAAAAAARADIGPALTLLLRHRADADPSAPVVRLRDKVVGVLLDQARASVDSQARLMADAIGAGSPVNPHVITDGLCLHVTRDAFATEGDQAVCGQRVGRHHHTTLVGAWAQATDEPTFGPEYESPYTERMTKDVLIAGRCATCAPYADMYEDCDAPPSPLALDDGHVALRDRFAAQQMAAHLHAILFDAETETFGLRAARGRLPGAAARSLRAGWDRALGQWLADEPSRFATFVGASHLPYYARRLAAKHRCDVADVKADMFAFLPEDLLRGLTDVADNAACRDNPTEALMQARRRVRHAIESAIDGRQRIGGERWL